MEPRTRVHILIVMFLSGAALSRAVPAGARVLMAQQDAIALAFPQEKPERRTAFLSDAQCKGIEEAAQSKLGSKIWTYYVAGSTSAYFESHLVRTMNETVMVVVGADGKVAFVEILSFAEPDDYLASKRWLGQFPGRRLDDDLALRRGLRNIAGASLTSEAVTRAVRRVLAVHQALNAKPVK